MGWVRAMEFDVFGAVFPYSFVLLWIAAKKNKRQRPRKSMWISFLFEIRLILPFIRLGEHCYHTCAQGLYAQNPPLSQKISSKKGFKVNILWETLKYEKFDWLSQFFQIFYKFLRNLDRGPLFSENFPRGGELYGRIWKKSWWRTGGKFGKMLGSFFSPKIFPLSLCIFLDPSPLKTRPCACMIGTGVLSE